MSEHDLAFLAMEYHSPGFGEPPMAPQKTRPHQWQLRDHLPADYDWLNDWSDEERQHLERPSWGMDESQSGKWYHTTPYSVQPGDKLVPGVSSPGGDDWYGHNNSNRQNYVWLSPNLEKAKYWRDNWAGSGSGIYEVHPGDRPQPWQVNGEQGWVAPHATVKKRVGGTK